MSILLFAVPVLLLLATMVAPRFSSPPQVAVQVTDRYTGEFITDAEIIANGTSVTGPAEGAVVLTLTDAPTDLRIQAPGYEAVTTTLTRGAPAEWQVALRPNAVSGQLLDQSTGTGIAGANVEIIAADAVPVATTTDANGRYALDGVPADATIRFTSADHGTVEEPIGQRTGIDLEMKPSFVAGSITDATGAPVAGARIAAPNGSAEVYSGADGTFRLTGGTEVEEVIVSAPGYSTVAMTVDGSRNVTAQLEGEMVKSLYANLGVLGDPERWNTLLEIADTTEINAIVIDVKQDTIYYDTQVQFFRDIDGMVTPVIDLPGILSQLEERGIYSIARMVVFKDPVVAAGRPDLAVRDEVTGDLWLDWSGTPWVNAFKEELWVANADLGAELAALGFDEVQYDYIRFPSDGDLRTADFGSGYSEAERRAAITGAVKLGSERVRGAGAAFAIDLFPIVALLGDDQGIGQTLQDLAPLADYICLMIYPSHYELGNIPVDGHPNDYPAETVTYTLERAEVWAPGTAKKMRPWLQDFNYPMEGFADYGPAEVRAQIDAAEAMGVSGWLLWNAAGVFEVSALNPE